MTDPPRDDVAGSVHSPPPQPPFRVLLIKEDSPRRRIEEFLRESPPEIHLRRSEDPAESLATLEARDAEERPDVVVLDLDVSEDVGPATVARHAEAAPSAGIMVLTGDEHRDAAQTVRRSEAVDPEAVEVVRKDALSPPLVGRTLRWTVERRRMQAELREREERRRSLADAVTEGLYRVAPGKGLVYANQRFAELFGYESVEAALEADPADLYVGAHDPFAWTEKTSETREVECRRSDGTIFPGRLSGTVTRDADGEIQYFTGAVTDITEREERKRDRQRRYEGIFNQTYQFTGLMEPDGTLIEANETALAFGGLEPDDVLGKPFWETYWWQVDDETQQDLRDAIERAADGEFVRYEVDVQGEDDIITIDFSIRPITDDDGEVTYLIPEGRDITELKTLKRQKRELERYRTIIENLPVGVFRTTPDGDIVNMNSTFASLFNAESKAQLQARTSQDVWAAPDKRPDLMEEVREKGTIQEKEVRLETLDGEPRWMEVTVTLTEEEEGPFLDGVLQDVTGRRRREQKLERQTELLSSLFDALPVGILVEDESREVLEVNEQYLDLWGILASPEEIVGWPTERIVDDVRDLVEDTEAFMARTQELFEERKPVRNEEIALTDGRTIARSHCIFDLPDGRGYLWVYRDITDQKQQEEELRRQKNLLEQTQRLAGAWEVDLETEEVSWSEEVYRIHELDPDTEVSFEKGIEFYAPESRPRAREAFRQCVEEGVPIDLELSIITAEGNRRWVRSVGSPIEEDGKTVKVVGAFQDITDRKRQEDALKDRQTRIEALYSTTDRLLRASSSEEVGDVLIELTQEVLGYPGVSVRTAQDGVLEVTHLAESTFQFMPERPPFAVDGESAVAEVYRSGETLVIEDLEAVEVDDPHDYGDLRSVVVVPLGTHGTFAVASPEPGAIGEFDSHLIEVLGTYAALVLDHIEQERSLRAAKGRYQTLVENFPDGGVFLFDEDLRYTLAGGSELKKVGLSPSDFEGARPEDLFPEGIARETAEHYRRALDGEKNTFEQEYQQRHYRVQTLPVRDETDAVISGMAVSQDVTERKRQKRELERQNDLFEKAQDIADVGAWEYVVENDTLQWTQEACRIHDLPPDTAIDLETAISFYHPDDRPLIRAAITEAIQDGTPYDLELRIETNAGEQRWVRTRGEPQREDGAVVRIRGTIQDITEEKRRELKLETTNTRLQLALESTNTGTFDWDIETDEVIWDETSERLFGYELGEFPDRYEAWADRVHPDDLPEAERAIDQALETGETYDTVFRVQPPSEEERWIRARGSVEHDEEGTPTRMVGIHTDVTEQKHREEELRRQKALLEQTQRLAGAWEANLQTGEVAWSDEVYEIHELEPGVEIDLERGLDFYTPESRERIMDATEVLVEEQEPYDLELSIITAEGNKRWVRTVGAPARTEAGEVVKVAGAFQDITERKQRERELERYERLVENLPVGVFRSTESGKFVDLNSAAADLYGGSPEQLRGTRADALYSHPEDRASLLDTLRREGRVEGRLLQMETLEGEERWVRATVNFATEDGERYLEGIVEDVTERRERQRRLEAVFNQTFQLTALMKPDGTILRVNDRAIQLLDVDRTELVGLKAWNAPWVRTEDAVERARNAIRTAREGDVARYEREVTAAGESRRVLDISFRPVTDDDGTVTLLVAEARDITEQKQREERLERRRRMVGSLYDATTRLLTAESRKAISDRIHELFSYVFDYTAVSTVFVDGDRLVPVDTSIDSTAQIPFTEPQPLDGQSVSAQAFRAGETVVEDAQSLDNALDYGELRSIAAVPMENYGVVVVGQADRETFDSFELQLIEVLASYAALVLDRLVREQELVEAKEEAEQANRTKSAFLANMSHEIRTPLTSILGFAEAIGDEVHAADDTSDINLPALRRFARLIEGSGERLMRTLTGVLNLSKLQAGEMALSAEPVDLLEQATQVIEELRTRANEKGVSLQVEDSGSVWGRADAGGVQIVIRNLLSNAIKYTRDGGKVRVRPRQTDDMAVLEVEDTGIGMEPETVDELFEPFRQESEGRAREYEGTGLGLAIIREAIQQMDGAIEVETEKGEGTCFTVRLPEAAPPAQA